MINEKKKQIYFLYVHLAVLTDAVKYFFSFHYHICISESQQQAAT